MNSKLLIGLVVLALGAGVGWYVLQDNKVPINQISTYDQTQQATTAPEPTVAEQTSTTGVTQGIDKGGAGGQATEKGVVSYTDSGFLPKSITVKQGTLLTFTNNSSRGMWVASAVHPTHQLLPGFDELKSVQKGGMYEYAFTAVGTWKYHNHVAPGDTGVVVVTK